MGNDWKERLGTVFSTNPDFEYNENNEEEEETLENNKQDLRVQIDRKQRKGKVVTLITGFVGTDDDLKSLGKILKTKCGTGGAAKDGEIIVQGEFKEKIFELLKGMGYGVKKAGGN